MANSISLPITASLHYSCNMAAKATFASTSRREAFEDKVEKFLNPENVQFFGQNNGLKTGDLFQLQKPSEWNVYDYDGLCNNKREVIDDFMVIVGDDSGCYNYVAAYNESKNSGRYQRLAKRVLASQTYVVYKSRKSGKYKLKCLLDNNAWLDAKKALFAFKFLARMSKLKVDEKSLQVVECMLHLPNKAVEIRAARVISATDANGAAKCLVMSMNSGKMWLLDADQCSIKADIASKGLIMTNFVGLKKTSEKGNYVRVS